MLYSHNVDNCLKEIETEFFIKKLLLVPRLMINVREDYLWSNASSLIIGQIVLKIRFILILKYMYHALVLHMSSDTIWL